MLKGMAELDQETADKILSLKVDGEYVGYALVMMSATISRLEAEDLHHPSINRNINLN